MAAESGPKCHGYQLPLKLDSSSQFCIDTLLPPWNNSILFGKFIPKAVKSPPKHNKTSLNN